MRPPLLRQPRPAAEIERRRLAAASRGTRQQRGYTDAWLRYSRNRLRSYPWCVQHEQLGRLVPAAVTDHIVPHRGDAQLFWDESNHQSLCKRCHDRKTAREDGGFGNPRRG
jgi:5-methylcytosine-specific restriction protein A